MGGFTRAAAIPLAEERYAAYQREADEEEG
jgi:hypothetical protein